MRASRLAVVFCSLSLLAVCGGGADRAVRSGTPATEADLARQRRQNESEDELASSIRRAILEDGELSPLAKGVSVVTDDGVVTLRGRVSSPGEKEAVAAIARRAPGVKRVDDQIGVVLR